MHIDSPPPDGDNSMHIRQHRKKHVNLNNNFKVGPRHWGGVKVANSAITGNNPYSWTLTDRRGSIRAPLVYQRAGTLNLPARSYFLFLYFKFDLLYDSISHGVLTVNAMLFLI